METDPCTVAVRAFFVRAVSWLCYRLARSRAFTSKPPDRRCLRQPVVFRVRKCFQELSVAAGFSMDRGWVGRLGVV